MRHDSMHVETPVQPFILTLALDDYLSRTLNALREKHFPKKRNFLDAHVTLFHALPGDREAALRHDLSAVCSKTPAFGVTLPRLHHWAKGVFAELESPALLGVRAQLADRWGGLLTRQDRQGYQPHVTIQNKVAKDEARALYETLTPEWQPLTGDALGLELWRYAGGPWVFAGSFGFNT